ncbi:YrdB family protein [Mycetocola zhadangensis]|uniref:YrdB family protein n=1 Tax=Mycetocola zhadangensis TaxID=1164595 RepID=UPI003A4E47FA
MSDSSQPSVTPNDILRLFLELFAIVSLGIWGFLGWSMPWNVIIGIGAPVVAILLWALFRSPKAVFSVDAYAKALIELLVMGAAALAWWDLGVPFVALVFGVVAVISGLVNGRREFSR